MPTIHIDVELDSEHAPDPTGGSDYAVVSLICAYLLFVFCGNLLLIRMSQRWLPVLGKNVPLVMLMSGASIVHIAAVFINMSYFPAITEAAERLSCVFFSFWLEYFFGLGTFLCTLALRILTLLFIVVPEMRPTSKAEHRNFALRATFVTFFMMPIFDICLLVTVDGADRYEVLDDAESTGERTVVCVTNNIYKYPMVGTLLAYILLLLLMCWKLRNTGRDLQQTPIVIDIIKVSIPLLVAACVLHFAYMLSYWWGRLAFMLVVLSLHFFAYARTVIPGLPEYFFSGEHLERTPFETERIIEIARDAQTDTINIDKDTLMRYENIRDDFFDYCIAASSDKLYHYGDRDLRDAMHFSMRQKDELVSIGRLIEFLKDVMALEKYRKDYLALDVLDTRLSLYKNRFKGQHSRVIRRYTDVAPQSNIKPVPIDAKLRDKLEHGFDNESKTDWNSTVLDEIISEVLSILVFEFASGYYAERSVEIYNMRQEHIAGVEKLTADDYYRVWLEDEESAPARSIPQIIFDTLSEGAQNKDDDELEHIFSEEYMTEEERKIILQNFNLPFSEYLKVKDEIRARQLDRINLKKPVYLEDGSIVYTSPWRALVAFFIDLVTCLVLCPCSVKSRYDEYNRQVVAEFQASRAEANDHSVLMRRLDGGDDA